MVRAVFRRKNLKSTRHSSISVPTLEQKSILFFLYNNSVCYKKFTPSSTVSPKSDFANFCQLRLHFSSQAAGQSLYEKSIIVDFKKGGVLKNFASKKLRDEMIMRYRLAVCLIMVGLFPWQAHGGENDRLDLANKIVAKTNISKMFVDMAAGFMDSYFERDEDPGTKNPADANPLKKIFEDEVSSGIEELTSMLAEIYATHFSENELREILSFFDSPAGAAWLDKNLIIQTEAEQVGLEWSQLLSRRVLKKFESQVGKKF
jgi:hypothetical protein